MDNIDNIFKTAFRNKTAGVELPLLDGKTIKLSLWVNSKGDDEISEAYLIIETSSGSSKRIPIPDVPRSQNDLKVAVRHWMNKYKKAVVDLDSLLSQPSPRRERAKGEKAEKAFE